LGGSGKLSIISVVVMQDTAVKRQQTAVALSTMHYS
jgi:hypothetical protein